MEEQRNRVTMFQNDNSPSDSIPSFLLKTYEILENQKYIDIISWTRSGQGFIVKKVKEFSENVLPIYFRHSNYTSFVRQLNMYDFHKTRQQNHQNAFKNLMFKRGFKHLLKDIQRKDYKKNKDNKDGAVDRNNLIEKAKDYSKADKNYELNNEFSRLNLNKLLDLSSVLQKKAICLAEMRDIPSKDAALLRLLDDLFDAKKIHREIAEKLQILSANSIENHGRKLKKLSSIENAEEKEFPTTSSKVSMFQIGKQERQISTNCFLSFNQI